MENLKKMIKMHSIKVIFVWLFFIVIAVTLMIVGDITPKSLISYCKVYNEDDLSRCFKENPYVEIHTKKVYDANYDYIHNKKVAARFVDIDLNGYFMISLMTPSKAQQLFTTESEDIVIKGKLEKFDTGAKLKGYNAIKEAYVVTMEEEATREEVMSNFTLVQFNEYNGSKIGIYIFAILGIGVIILFFVLIIKQFLFFIHPERYHLNKNITLGDEKSVEKIMKELESNDYSYHDKNIYITKNYLISKIGGMAVAEKKNVAWIYEKIIKQNGITTGKSWIVFSLDQKNPFNFGNFGKKHKELGEILKKEFPNATFGFSNELSREWHKNPEIFIKKEEDR